VETPKLNQITDFHSTPLNISTKTVASPMTGMPMNTNPNINNESPTFIDNLQSHFRPLVELSTCHNLHAIAHD
jgi:hypothetical protein